MILLFSTSASLNPTHFDGIVNMAVDELRSATFHLQDTPTGMRRHTLKTLHFLLCEFCYPLSSFMLKLLLKNENLIQTLQLLLLNPLV